MMRALSALFAISLVALGSWAKVPQISLQATCNRATLIFVGKVESVERVTSLESRHEHWVAKIDISQHVKGRLEGRLARVYYQPNSSVSAQFAIGASYVVFAMPYKDGLATVNGDAASFEVRSGVVDDAALVDGIGESSVDDFVNRVRKCAASDTN